MDTIDLRSDTVTWPTPAMREAMAHAVVGDDVYGEDPTVNELEAVTAAMFGKEAALFVVSGTMANLTAILAQAGRGDEVILGDKAHTFNYEVGSLAALGGIQPHPIPVQADGTFLLEDIRAAIRDRDNVHYPTTRLIALENAQCGVGGMPLSATYTAQVAALAAEFGLKVHIDGSRIFNAATALGCSVADLVEPADSVSFCLSKGLAAPVGAMVAGSADLINRARRVRKALGGGMRQAGVLAAAGLVALRDMPGRVQDDHDTAAALAAGLAELPGMVLDPAQVKINIVRCWLDERVPQSAYDIAEILKQQGILVGPRDSRSFRLVTHYWISADDIQRVVGAFKEVLA
ncbi:MAG: low-specificity L-threonine aldolase [Anaerolineae bacterium]|nr:low-specificity L-threonine aldolase [Anaerolineae bacterium]